MSDQIGEKEPISTNEADILVRFGDCDYRFPLLLTPGRGVEQLRRTWLRGGPLAESVEAVCFQMFVAIGPAGRPTDLNAIDRWDHPEPEEEATITGRLIAAPPDPLRHLAPAAGFDRNDGPDAVPIRGHSLKGEAHEVTTLGGSIVQIHQWFIEGDE